MRLEKDATDVMIGPNTQTTTAIEQITYDAKGQKLALKLGNDAVTRYTYDPNTFRLTHLFTRRPASFTGDCASGTADDPRPQRPCGVQNLHYTYDPVGNITHIQDDAQQTIFFDGAMVEPSNDYVYDALYRLITATGRETAQGGDAARDGKDADYAHGFPVTDQTLRIYTESCAYDSVGNFVTFSHVILGDSTNTWTRQYAYAFDDSTQPASNRLWKTWTGTKDWDQTPVEKRAKYSHDPHGNMLNLASTDPQFNLRWDHRDMIRNLDLGGGGQAYYQYDSGKQRTRKIIARNPPDNSSHTIKEERIYLGGYELYRRYTGDPNDPIEEIESHHLFAGRGATRAAGRRCPHRRRSHASAPGRMVGPGESANPLSLSVRQSPRLCLSRTRRSSRLNHFIRGVSSVGTSAFRAMSSTGLNALPPKRYRYTGKERDEESGLNYHGARYLIPWLGRWASTDPSGTSDGINIWQFVHGNPVHLRDANGKFAGPDVFSFLTGRSTTEDSEG